jgi:virginiamycin B lyase
MTEYPLPGDVEAEAIAAGPDGAMWFTEYGSSDLGRITTRGKVSFFRRAGGELQHDPFGIAAGPDGALWLTQYSGSSIVRAARRH